MSLLMSSLTVEVAGISTSVFGLFTILRHLLGIEASECLTITLTLA